MLRKWLTGIRTQMVLLFIAFSLLISVLISVICLNIIHSTMEDQAVTATVNMIGQVNTETQILIDEAMRLLQWGDVDVVQNFLYGTGMRHAAASEMVAAFNNLRTSKFVGDNVRNVYIFDTDGYAYNERTGLILLNREARSQRILDLVTANPDRLLYLSDDPDSRGSDAIIIGIPIRQTATRRVLGYIAVELKADVISAILDSVTFGQSGSFFILDETGAIILGNDTNHRDIPARLSASTGTAPEATVLEDAQGKVIAVRSPLKEMRWSLVGCVPLQELMSDFNYLQGFVVLMIAVVLLSSITLYIFSTKRLTYPIQRLKRRMLEAADGNLNAVVENVSKNEFSILENQYNRMLSDIRALIQRNQEEQKNMQKAEFRALQAQINPHFLYNTLDTIIWLVAANENNNAIRMIEQLSIFFRIGLSKGLDWVSVREDIEHLYSYLYIQRVRYSDLLDFSMEVDDRILDCIMPKMTLQPIVENAIYHGIKNKKNGGRITVTGIMDEFGCLVFTVSDSGVGMEEEACRQLEERLQRNSGTFEDKEDGFGLYNVNRRIKLYCGEEYGLSIRSKPGAGTTVLIRMRPREGGDKDV
ncbi:MAG: sensor histidine kinase [Candidatus Limiplasma sp.]|nr:sensor histidine kinase [Candidatus Limiplasma sp.]